MSDAGTFLNWFVAALSAVLLAVIVISWLISFRTQKTIAFGSSKWFSIPVWALIGAGFAALAFFGYLGYRLWIPLPISTPGGVLNLFRFAGLALFLAGWLLMLWARWALGGMYGVSTASAVRLRSQHRLVRHGPFAFIRHPMYLGIWLVLLGLTLLYRTWAPLVLLVIFLPLYRRAQREEAALAATFGEEWQIYSARVPMFLPRLRRKGS
ncbi:MAG: methyltransferase family protein [Anaerolineales bacterium]